MILSQPPKKVARQSARPSYDVIPSGAPKRMPPIMNEWPAMRERPAARERGTSSGSGSLVLFFLVIFGVAALAYYSVTQDYLLGQVLACAASPLMLYGLWRGGLRKIATLATMFAFGAVLTACPGILDGVIASPVGQCAAISAALVVTLLIVGRVAKSLRRRWVEDRRGMQFLDRAFGAGVGLAEAALVVLTMAWMTSELRPFAEQLRDRPDMAGSSIGGRLASAMIQFGAEADAGQVGDWVRATNPIGKMPVLRDAIQELNHTGRLPANLLNSESLKDTLNGLDTSGAGLGQFTDMIKKYEESNKSREDAYRRLSNSKKR